MSAIPAPAHEPASERGVLARSLEDPQALKVARSLLSAEDFWTPAHREVWDVVCELDDAGGLDPAAVATTMRTRGSRALEVLVTLVGAWDVSDVEWHCRRMIAATASRGLLMAAQRLLQRLPATEDPIALAEEAIDALRLVQRANVEPQAGPLDVLDVIERQHIDSFVVPGLLARTNRIIITAPEGWGKSSLLRQIGMCAAAGVHPFKPIGHTHPRTVLVVDAENPSEINTAEYRRLYEGLASLDRAPERNALFIEESGPLDLLDAREAARLYATVERLQPDLICIGPIYQLHTEDPNEERAARKLAAVLDRVRLISGAALVTEAHTPHNDGAQGQLLRPYGASLWKRWPEFGYCLHPTVRPRAGVRLTPEEEASVACRESYFTAWRGNRAARAWPGLLSMGRVLLWQEAQR